jgi:tetratricopeptide (TPR) repeat protein
MTRGLRGLLQVALLLGCVFAGWRIVGLMQADAALARGDVAAALRWRPEHTEALLKQAEAQLAAKDAVAASASARRLLEAAPMDGRGYRVLAQVAVAEERTDQARTLYRIAARRAPRDLQARAWLAQDALERGDPTDALAQIDAVLTLSPGAGAAVFPVLVALAADPSFADALAEMLRRMPPWRAGMLAALHRAKPGDREAADQVLGALQRKGGFSAEETAVWIEALLREGRWGQAHARWATPLVAGGKPLPLLFNGDFAQDPGGTGFDWRLPAIPGVIVTFEPDQGQGRALRARFLGRRVVGAFLEHRLLLAPGHYRLRYRLRTDALRSDRGLGWRLACDGQAASLATGAPIGGTRGWHVVELAFTVPARDCAGQWLRFGNAGAGNAGQLVNGDLWLAAVVVEGRKAVRPADEETSQPVAPTH